MMMCGSVCEAPDINSSVERVDSLGVPFLLGTTTPRGEACARAAHLDAWSVAPWSFSLCCAYVSEQPHHGILQWKEQWAVQPANEVVCRACGCSDIIVASGILRPRACPLSLSQLAPLQREKTKESRKEMERKDNIKERSRVNRRLHHLQRLQTTVRHRPTV